MPKVSVIIPVFNAETYLRQCLDSVCAQTLCDIEVLCVENASIDESLAICTEYAKRDSRVRVIDLGANRGAGPARNEAIRQARGEFLAFMDADDWYPDPSSLEVLYSAAIEHGCDIAGGCMTEYNAATGEVISDYQGRGHLEAYQFVRDEVIEYRDWQSDLGWIRFIYRREFVLEHGIEFPALTRHEDPVFLVRAMVAAGRFYASTVAAYRYRVFYKSAGLTQENLDDALEGISIVLGIAEAEGLETLRSWCVETIWWYLTLSPEWARREEHIGELNRAIDAEREAGLRTQAILDEVLNSKSFRLGERIAAPYRRLRDALARRDEPGQGSGEENAAPPRTPAPASDGESVPLAFLEPSVVARALGRAGAPCQEGVADPIAHLLAAPDDEISQIIDNMVEAGDGMRLAIALADANLDFSVLCRLASAVQGSKTFAPAREAREAKSVASYYYAATGGGVETAMIALKDACADAYEMSIITENALTEAGERLYSVGDIAAQQGMTRMEAFAEALRQSGCDTLVYHAWADPKMLFDLMVCRMLGIRFVLQIHGAFSHFMNVSDARFGMLNEGRTFVYVPRVASLCDAIVCLSSVNKRFFSHFNPRVFEVRHPVPKAYVTDLISAPERTRDDDLVVWVGRFDAYKHPDDALDIFKRVRERRPSARLVMLGESFGGDFEGENSVAAIAERLGIADAVEFPGFVDAKPYYEKAAALLLTTEIEGFSMVLLEACACGLPAVSYSMPYVPFAACAGITWVAQGDKAQAAERLSALLGDAGERARLGELEREFLLHDRTYNGVDTWPEVFACLGRTFEESDPAALDDAEERLVWETLFDHYLVGQQRAHEA